jgi:hypothetical protein
MSITSEQLQQIIDEELQKSGGVVLQDAMRGHFTAIFDVAQVLVDDGEVSQDIEGILNVILEAFDAIKSRRIE